MTLKPLGFVAAIGPSYREGLPRYLIESSASLTLVTTDVAGCRAVVRPGNSGLLVPPETLASCAPALRYLLGDLDLRRRCCAQSRLRGQGERGNEGIFAPVPSVYRELLDRP